jgi:hypothetical protein
LNKPEPEEQNITPEQEEDAEAAPEIDELYGYEYGGEDYGAEDA